MSLTESTMLELGTEAPAFSLPDVTTGETVSLESFADREGLLVMFICRHCPYVQHVKEELSRLGRDYEGSAVGIVAISANDGATYSDDAPPSLKAFAEEQGFAFPLLHDESQETAKAYTAACTPDFFLFDRERKRVYRGQLDAARPGRSAPSDGADLRRALDQVIAGTAVPPEQRPSIGCNIKWRPGNEPPYFG